jgi:hypothetical protein
MALSARLDLIAWHIGMPTDAQIGVAARPI